jgi:hypothetical protein
MSFDPDYNSSYPVILQTCDWSCSACSWAWLAGSIGQYESEWSAVERIGFPANVNATYGLMDASGKALADAYSQSYSWPSHYSPAVTYADAISLAWAGPLLLGGRQWCHWTAVRGTDGRVLQLANPAPFWFGVGQVLNEPQWDRLGPWSAVWLSEGQTTP